jgi:hypothetical protein
VILVNGFFNEMLSVNISAMLLAMKTEEVLKHNFDFFSFVRLIRSAFLYYYYYYLFFLFSKVRADAK